MMNKNEIKGRKEISLPKHYMDELARLDANKKKNYEEMKEEICRKYQEVFGKELCWENPSSYNEKICVSMLDDRKIYRSILTDKVAVREWVKKKIGSKYLIPILGVYDCFDEIELETLPDQFVMKCSHDSSSITVCTDKSALDWEELREKYAFFMKRNFAYLFYEMQYASIHPKIIVEQYMGELMDYKFLCFHGVPRYCWIDMDRFAHHTRNFYDMKWNLEPFGKLYPLCNHDVPCPKEFDEMKHVAEILCKGMDQVRVDLYDINQSVYFGEMTFTTEAGIGPFFPSQYDLEIGKYWILHQGTENSEKEEEGTVD